MEKVKFIGGALCLDFVNTVGGRREGTVLREKIVSDTDLLHWGELAGLISHSRHNGSRAVERAVAIREALYGILKPAVDGRTPAAADLDLFNRELAAVRARRRLAQHDGKFEWAWASPQSAVERILGEVLESAAELLTSPALARLRECQGPECGWLFLDTSRNRSRHWCDMRDCGNLAKVRRFRSRNR